MSLRIRRSVGGVGQPCYTHLIFSKDYQLKWETNEYEHNQILKIFKQDGKHEDVENDHTDYSFNE